MKRFERIDKMQQERFNSRPFFAGFYSSLRKSKQETRQSIFFWPSPKRRVNYQAATAFPT